MKKYNNDKAMEKRKQKRRIAVDRRDAVRFDDSLGRRTGIERRLSESITSSAMQK